jgi:hypothetical protein
VIWTKILQVECLDYNKEVASLASLFHLPFPLILFLVNDIKSKKLYKQVFGYYLKRKVIYLYDGDLLKVILAGDVWMNIKVYNQPRDKIKANKGFGNGVFVNTRLVTRLIL